MCYKNFVSIYELLKCQKYEVSFDELPMRLQSALQIENIGAVGAEHEISPMFIVNHLLSSPVPPIEVIMQKYIGFLFRIPTACLMTPRQITEMLRDEFLCEKLDDNIDLAWKEIDVLLKQTFVMPEYQLNEYNIRKTQVLSIANAQQNTQLQELHNNFIQDNTFINIGQVVLTTLSEITKTQSNKVNQRITPQQAKANAKI